MNLTKEYEHELYNDEALISVVNVGYGYASPHDADEKEKAARKLGLNTVVQAGNYVKVLDLPSIILIVENEMNEIAFYKSFSIPTGVDHASLLTTEIYREDLTPVQTAIELAEEGFGISLNEPILLTETPLHFSKISDEKFYVVYGRCSNYNKEDGGDELFWIHEPNAMVRIQHQLTKGTPFALEREGATLNDFSIAALLLKKWLYNS